jgi:hypothetical protein
VNVYKPERCEFKFSDKYGSVVLTAKENKQESNEKEVSFKITVKGCENIEENFENGVYFYTLEKTSVDDDNESSFWDND